MSRRPEGYVALETRYIDGSPLGEMVIIEEAQANLRSIQLGTILALRGGETVSDKWGLSYRPKRARVNPELQAVVSGVNRRGTRIELATPGGEPFLRRPVECESAQGAGLAVGDTVILSGFEPIWDDEESLDWAYRVRGVEVVRRPVSVSERMERRSDDGLWLRRAEDARARFANAWLNGYMEPFFCWSGEYSSLVEGDGYAILRAVRFEPSEDFRYTAEIVARLSPKASAVAATLVVSVADDPLEVALEVSAEAHSVVEAVAWLESERMGVARRLERQMAFSDKRVAFDDAVSHMRELARRG